MVSLAAYHLNVQTSRAHHCADVTHMRALLAGAKGKVDVCELCGGAGRTTQIAVRRRLVSGGNYDLVTGYDLGNRQHQQSILNYVTTNNVLVVMSPSCRTLGPPSNLT